MEGPVSNENMNRTILNEVREDMRVCDNAGNEIGRVRQVYLGEVSGEINERGDGPATAVESQWHNNTLVDYVARGLAADEPLPEVLRNRMLREGYILIDSSGLFASDRYALPDQIEGVSDDCVRLRLSKDKLIER